MEFSLRERLEQAANQRRIAAGLPPSRQPTLVEPTEVAPPDQPAELPLPDAEEALADLMIDLRDPASVLTYTELPRDTLTGSVTNSVFTTSSAAVDLPVWNGQTLPARSTMPEPRVSRRSSATREKCPACLGPAMLANFDLEHGVAHLKCADCGLEFTNKRPRL